MTASAIKGLDTGAGAFRFVRVDAAGQILTALAPLAPGVDLSAGLSVGRIVAVLPATLFGWVARNASANARWIQFFDAIAMPLDGTVPYLCPILLPANSQTTLDLGQVPFPTGIVWCSSSTELLKTISGVPDLWVDVLWL